MAEREGFEPSIPLLAEYTISKRAPSASRASLPLLERYAHSACLWFVTHGALNYAEFRAAMHPTWCMAERVGFEPKPLSITI